MIAWRPSVRKSQWLVLALMTAMLAAPTWTRAATPRDELLGLVPEDAAFCLVIQDLRSHALDLINSPFFKEFEKSRLSRCLSGDQDALQLQAALHEVLGVLDTTWPELRDEIIGDAIVISYRPGATRHDESERGLILIRARNAPLLNTLLDRLDEAQAQAGDIKVQVRKHDGDSYRERKDAKGQQYFYVDQGLLAISRSEMAIRNVIDRHHSAPKPFESTVALQLGQLGADKALAALWINPRAFEARMAQHASEAGNEDVALHRAILTYWKALTGIALTLSLDRDDADLRLTLRTDATRLPEAARKFVTAEPRQAEVWARFPEPAIFTVAGRLDTAGWDDFLSTFMEPKVRAELVQRVNRRTEAIGDDFVKRILPCLGPDWGFCVAAPPAGSDAWFPHALAALRIRATTDQPAIDQTIVNTLYFLTGIFVLAYNGDHDSTLSLHRETRDGCTLTYLTNDREFPKGLRPAFALKEGYLLLGSSPEAIARFRAGPLTAVSVPGRKGTGTGSPRPPEGERGGGEGASGANRVGAIPPVAEGSEIPLARLSLENLRLFITERMSDVARHISKKENLPEDEARRRLSALCEVARLFKTVEFVQQSQPNQISLVLRVRPEAPLK
jgi:hypothetical protein